MTKRITILVAICTLAGISTAAFWFWPESPGRLPKSAFTQGRDKLYIVRIEPVANESVEAFVTTLSPWLPVEVRVSDEWRLDERHTLTWDGDLYDVDYLIDRLVDTVPRGTRVMAITDQAMHDEEHWWLYGKGGEAAIISTAHLWADDAEGDARHPVFRERLAKVGVHELGHCLGFQHCNDTRCVMRFSTELHTLDATRPRFCNQCIRTWRSWN